MSRGHSALHGALVPSAARSLSTGLSYRETPGDAPWMRTQQVWLGEAGPGWAVLWPNEVSPTSLTHASLCVARPASTRRESAPPKKGVYCLPPGGCPGPPALSTRSRRSAPSFPLLFLRSAIPRGSLPLHGEARCLLPRQLIVKEIAFPVPP